MDKKDYTFEKEINRYLRKVSHALDLPREIRRRVVSDLKTTILARVESGERFDGVLASLGSPRSAAATLNEEMAEYAYRKSPLRFLFVTVAAVAALWLLVKAGFAVYFACHVLSSVGVIGGADGPTSIFVTTAPSGIHFADMLPLILLIGGFIGYYCFSHLKPMKTEEK